MTARFVIFVFAALAMSGCGGAVAAKLDYQINSWRWECAGEHTVSCANRAAKINVGIARLVSDRLDEEVKRDRRAGAPTLTDEQLSAGLYAVDVAIIRVARKHRPNFIRRWLMGGSQVLDVPRNITSSIISPDQVEEVFLMGVREYNRANGVDMTSVIAPNEVTEPPGVAGSGQHVLELVTDKSPALDDVAESEAESFRPAVPYDLGNQHEPERVNGGAQVQPVESLEHITSAAPVPGFDCSRAATYVENMICSDTELARLDSAMSENYRRIIDSSGQRADLVDSQRRWLRSNRNECQSFGCVRSAYEERLLELARTEESNFGAE